MWIAFFMDQYVRTSRYFNGLSAVFAFLLWGGWAWHINSQTSTQSGIVAGLTQGTSSFLITLFMVHTITLLFHRFHHPFIKVLLPAVIVVCSTSLFLYTVHLVMGTPRILATILPAITVAFSFCLFTSFKLLRIHQQRSSQYE